MKTLKASSQNIGKVSGFSGSFIEAFRNECYAEYTQTDPQPKKEVPSIRIRSLKNVLVKVDKKFITIRELEKPPILFYEWYELSNFEKLFQLLQSYGDWMIPEVCRQIREKNKVWYPC